MFITSSPRHGIQTDNPYNLSQVKKFTVNYLGNYLAGNTFAILFSLMVIAEQNSLQRAQTLAQQVESKRDRT